MAKFTINNWTEHAVAIAGLILLMDDSATRGLSAADAAASVRLAKAIETFERHSLGW
jgi:hypothetical protein